jgi:hypothetical protein
VLSHHPERMGKGQQMAIKALRTLPDKMRSLLIQYTSTQWFVILSE